MHKIKRLPPKTRSKKRARIIISNRIGQAIIDVASEKKVDTDVIKTQILSDIPELGKTLLGRIIGNSSQPSFRQAYLIAKSIGRSVDDLYQAK